MFLLSFWVHVLELSEPMNEHTVLGAIRPVVVPIASVQQPKQGEVGDLLHVSVHKLHSFVFVVS